MTQTIKIPRIGEKKEINLKIFFPKKIHDLLSCYAEAYEATYGDKIKAEALVPVICDEFLHNDSGFKKYLAKQKLAGKKM